MTTRSPSGDTCQGYSQRAGREHRASVADARAVVATAWAVPEGASGDDTLSLDFQSAHVVQRAPMEVPLESRLAAEQEDPSIPSQGRAA